MDSPATDPLVGRTLDGRYRVVARLARGGMATVYEGLDTRLDRPVALKVMHPGLAEDHAFVTRFGQEARSAARLSHPNVVAVYDQGDDDGSVFLAMEYVPGRTLRDLLRERTRLSPREAFDVLEPVLAALGAAHRAGLVHRDVKPENVLLADDGRVKVADFGLARAATADGTSQATQGMLIGTVAYLAPEQVEHGRADTRTDVYSAGILLYEMLTGHAPFTGANAMAVAFRHVHEDVPAPSAAAPGLSPEIDRLVATATSRNPAERPADADRLLALVETTRDRLSPTELGPSASAADFVDLAETLVVPVAGRRQPVPAAVGAVGAAGTTGTTGTASGGTSAAPPAAPPAPPPSDSPPGGEGPLPPRVVPTPEGPPPTVRGARRRPVLVGLLILLAVAAAVGIGGWLLGSARSTVTPAVVGMTTDAATEALTAAELEAAVGTPEFSETVKTGLVISTDPVAGAKIRKGGTVNLVVSRGPERYAVPDVRGKTVAEATDALAAVHLVLGTQTQAFSETVPKGAIISTSPAASAKVKRDTAVRAVVSKGLPPVAVPKVAGLTLDAATKALSAKKLKIAKSSEAYNETVPKGSVISQSPAPGQTVLQGSTVSVVVSKGPPLVEVPSVTDRKTSDAVRILEQAGFTVKINKPPVVFLNRVISQSPGAGSKAPKGSTVTISVI